MDTNESYRVNEDSEQSTRSYQVPADQFGSGIRMNLRKQPRREYNVFNLEGNTINEHVVLLQFDDHMDLNEQSVKKDEAECLFLTETLGWKDGLPEVEQMQHETTEMNMEAVNLLAEYMFLTDQLGWKQGITIFQE